MQSFRFLAEFTSHSKMWDKYERWCVISASLSFAFFVKLAQIFLVGLAGFSFT